jgi:hypothetical protein
VAKYSLGKLVVGSQWLDSGAIANSDGSISKAFEMEPLSSGGLEESFNGPVAEQFFSKLADLLTRLPNSFEGQILFHAEVMIRRALQVFELAYSFSRRPRRLKATRTFRQF